MDIPEQLKVRNLINKLKGSPDEGAVRDVIEQISKECDVVPGECWVREGLFEVLCKVQQDVCVEIVAKVSLKVVGGQEKVLAGLFKLLLGIIRQARTADENITVVRLIACIVSSNPKAVKVLKACEAASVLSQFYKRFLMLPKTEPCEPPSSSISPTIPVRPPPRLSSPQAQASPNSSVCVAGANGKVLKIPTLAISPEVTQDNHQSPTRVMRLVKGKNQRPMLSNWQISTNDMSLIFKEVGTQNARSGYQDSVMKLAHTIGQGYVLKDLRRLLRCKRDAGVGAESKNLRQGQQQSTSAEGTETQVKTAGLRTLVAFLLETLHSTSCLDLALIEIDTLFSEESLALAADMQLHGIFNRIILESATYYHHHPLSSNAFLTRWPQLIAVSKAQPNQLTYHSILNKYLRLLSDYLIPFKGKVSLIIPNAVESCKHIIVKTVMSCVRLNDTHPCTHETIRLLGVVFGCKEGAEFVFRLLSYDDEQVLRWVISITEKFLQPKNSSHGYAEVLCEFWLAYVKSADQSSRPNLKSLDFLVSPYVGLVPLWLVHSDLFSFTRVKITLLKLVLALLASKSPTPLCDKSATASYARLHFVASLQMYHNSYLGGGDAVYSNEKLCRMHLKCLAVMLCRGGYVKTKVGQLGLLGILLEEVCLESTSEDRRTCLVEEEAEEPDVNVATPSSTTLPPLPLPLPLSVGKNKPLIPVLQLRNAAASSWGVTPPMMMSALSAPSSVRKAAVPAAAAAMKKQKNRDAALSQEVLSDPDAYRDYEKSLRPLYTHTKVHKWVVLTILVIVVDPDPKGAVDSRYGRETFGVLAEHLNHPENDRVVCMVLKALKKLGNRVRDRAEILLKALYNGAGNGRWFKTRGKAGCGGFGSVAMCEAVGSKGATIVAVKQIPTGGDNVPDLVSEVAIMTDLKDSGGLVLELLDFGLDETYSFTIVTPLWPISLKAYRATHGVPKNLREMYLQALDAVEYIHKKSVIHFDIKCGNILLSSEVSICLADFGEALYTTEGERFRKRARGTECIRPPEVVRTYHKDYDRRRLNDAFPSEKIDVWGLGCMLYEVVSGKYLFDPENFGEFFSLLTDPGTSILTAEAEECLERAGKAFPKYLKMHLVRDPCSRPTVSDIKRMEFPSSCSVVASGNVLHGAAAAAAAPRERDKITRIRSSSVTLSDLRWLAPRSGTGVHSTDPATDETTTVNPLEVAPNLYVTNVSPGSKQAAIPDIKFTYHVSLLKGSLPGVEPEAVDYLGSALASSITPTGSLPVVRCSVPKPSTPTCKPVREALVNTLQTIRKKCLRQGSKVLIIGQGDRPLCIAVLYLVVVYGMEGLRASLYFWRFPELVPLMRQYDSRPHFLTLLYFLDFLGSGSGGCAVSKQALPRPHRHTPSWCCCPCGAVSIPRQSKTPCPMMVEPPSVWLPHLAQVASFYAFSEPWSLAVTTTPLSPQLLTSLKEHGGVFLCDVCAYPMCSKDSVGGCIVNTTLRNHKEVQDMRPQALQRFREGVKGHG